MDRDTKGTGTQEVVATSVLALATFFEQNFSIDWIVALSGEKVSSILEQLGEGVNRGWLRHLDSHFYEFADLRIKRSMRKGFTFEHEQNVIRRIVSLLIAELFDEKNKALALSPYLLRISNDVEGCRWLIRAGNQLRRDYQVEEALQRYDKALEDLTSLEGDEADRLFTETVIQHCKISTAKFDTLKDRALIEEAIKRSQRLQDNGSLALLHMHLAKNEWLAGSYVEAIEHFEQGWSMAKELDDEHFLRAATTFTTFFFYWQGRFRDAVANYEKAASYVEKIPVREYHPLDLITVALCYTSAGQVSQGLGMMNEIRAHCLQNGDYYFAAQADAAIADTMLSIRRPQEALPYLENLVLKESEKHHNRYIAIIGLLLLSYAWYLLQDCERSIKYLRRYLAASRRLHIMVQPYPYVLSLAWAMEQGHLPRVPHVALEDEIQRVLAGKNVFVKGVAYRYRALLQFRRGFPEHKVTESLNLSLRWLEVSGSEIEIARTQAEMARVGMQWSKSEIAQRSADQVVKILANLNHQFIPEDLRSYHQGEIEGERYLEQILKLTEKVVTLCDRRDTFREIISAVNRLTGAERGAILQVDNSVDPPRLELSASINMGADDTAHPHFRQSLELIQEVVRTRQGQTMELSSDVERSCGPEIYAAICIPMVLRNKLLGVMYHDNRLLRQTFKDSDLRALAHFASQAAIAIDNATAYEEIKRLNRKLREEKNYYAHESLGHFHLESIIGNSPAMMKMVAQVKQVAETDAAVLILGETGVGKELVARAIHNLSVRKDKPFITVLCNTVPDSLICSELFGHERGAFTGATERRIGRFELGDSGTVFLDEIGELPVDAQVRLLRVLQTKEFERVGGSQTLKSDFRLVTATNRDLENEIRAKRLRMDLYYRLNVFPIHVPPLRERMEDIPLLANHFLQSFAVTTGKHFNPITEEEIDKLMRYDWPGNVRELENLIERAVIINPGPRFQLPDETTLFASVFEENPDRSLRAAERHHIIWALNRTGWKVKGRGGAAEFLDIPPSTLIYRMKKHQIVKSPS